MIKVSILTLAYNQEKFIRQTLDGFLMQKAGFDFEVIIHDDASTDNTGRIIQEYAKKHPNVIKPILEKENQYSKRDWDFINDMFRAAKGTYIAMCEGDDYWTDTKKLQKQVDFLDSHPDYTVCFHPVKIVFENKEEKSVVSPHEFAPEKLTVKELLQDNFIYTNSVMYRKLTYEHLARFLMPQDLYIHLYHAKAGKIGFIKDVMSVYRRQSGGVWWDSYKAMDNIYKKQPLELVSFYNELLKMFGDNEEYVDVIQKHIIHLLGRFAYIDSHESLHLIEAVIAEFPQVASLYIHQQKQQVDKEIDRLTKDVNELKDALQKKEQDLSEIKTTLDKIHQSYGYRLAKKAVDVKRKLTDPNK